MKRAFSLFLVILLLTTQVGVSFATHYCGGKVFKNKISLLGDKLPSCGMKGLEEEDCNSQSHFKSKSCCENHAVNFQVKDKYNTSSLALENNFLFLARFTTYYIYFIQLEDSYSVSIAHYDPPVFEHDIPVLIQSFLI